MRPDFMAAERGVANARPGRAERQRGIFAAPACGVVVLILQCGLQLFIRNHLRAVGTVIGKEQYQRVIELPFFFKQRKHAADLTVDEIHHRGMDLHFVGLLFFLLIGQLFPGRVLIDIIEAHLLIPYFPGFLGLRRMRRDHFRFRSGKFPAGRETERLLFFVTPLTDHIPALIVHAVILINKFLRGFQRIMRPGKRQITEKRLIRMFGVMILEKSEHVSAGRLVHKKAVFRLRTGKHLPVQCVIERCIINPALCVVVGAVEAAGVRRIATGGLHMPFAGVICPVAERLKHSGKRCRPLHIIALFAVRIGTGLRRVITGHDGTARRPAAGAIIKLREPQSVGGEPVEVRRFNFTAVTAQVGESHVIGKDKKYVRAGLCRFGTTC